MKKKKGKGSFWLLLVLALVLLTAGAGTVSAMATRTITYQNGQENTRNTGKEKQFLANSYSGEYNIAFSYGFQGNYQDGNHVPVRVNISNQSAVEFEGYFVFQVKNDTTSIYQGNSGAGIIAKLFPGVKKSEDTRNSLFTYRFPIHIPANGEITKTFSAGLMAENVSYCVLSLENSLNDTVYSREETISNENFFHSSVRVCVVEEETDYGRQLNGITLDDGVYEVEASSASPEELTGLAESYAPDVLILLEHTVEELSREAQQEIDEWQAEGGRLIVFGGDNAYTESQRNAFKEAPAEFLKNMLDEDTTGHITANRNANYQKYYTISDQLENTKVRNQPNTILYGAIILIYLVLVGPGLYYLLKRLGKRRYLWGAICGCSACFLVMISLLGKTTQLRAPVLTYVREVWQYDCYQKESINFCTQAPYNASYELYLDPSYDLVTYSRMDYVSNNVVDMPEKDDEYEKTEISFGDQKNRVELSNMAAFALNEFGMQKTKMLEAGEGLVGEFSFWNQAVSGTVKNTTGYDMTNCVLALPGYFVWIGDLKNGEEKVLDQTPADSAREIVSWDAVADLPEMEKNYLEGVVYNHMPNRTTNCLLFGKIKGEGDSFQMDSGYEAYGISYYFEETSVEMTKGNVFYCPYAQEYSGWDGNSLNFEMGPGSGGISDDEVEVTYYLNAIFEDNNIWELYRQYVKQLIGTDRTGIASPDFWPEAMHSMQDRIQAAESGVGEKRGTILSIRFQKALQEEDSHFHNFDGTIELYNFKTEEYEELTDWGTDFTDEPSLLAQYVNDENQIRVRYRLSEEEKTEEYHKNYGYYETPNLIVTAEKLPTEEYLKNLFADETITEETEKTNADTEN